MPRRYGLALVALFFVSLSSCFDQSKRGKTPTVFAGGRIGMTCMDLTNPFFKHIADVMSAEAEKHGYEVVALDGANDPALQNTQISEFVAQGVDAIFLNPADAKAAAEGVRKAHEAGVPVFTFDSQVDGDEAKAMVTSHVGSDNFQEVNWRGRV